MLFNVSETFLDLTKGFSASKSAFTCERWGSAKVYQRDKACNKREPIIGFFSSKYLAKPTKCWTPKLQVFTGFAFNP